MTADPNDPATLLVYANWVRTQMTPYDVALDFGYRAGPSPPDHVPVRLVMTWEHTKDLVKLLNNAVEQYEGQMGAIRDLGTEITPAQEPEPEAGD